MEDMVDYGSWKGRRVLVTGATGLVGSWLVKVLVGAEAQVTALVRDWDPQSELLRSGTVNKISIVNGVLEDFYCVERAINEHEVDTVFHLGAQTIVGTANRSPLPTFEANIRGTYNLLEACRRHPTVTRIVIASSDKAYGTGTTLPYTEEMPPLGQHPYDVSKSCADLISQAYHHTYGLPVIIARCGNIYGGGDLNWNRIIPGTIRSLHQGESPIIRSDGKFTRDYIYVQDAVQAYMTMAQALESKELSGHAFNFGPSQPLSVIEVVKTLCRLMDREDILPVILDEAKSEIRDQYLDSSKAQKLLGWSPQYTLEEGLKETIAWYLQYFAANATVSV